MRSRYLFAALKNQLDPPQTVALTLAVRDLIKPRERGVVGLCPSDIALAWTSSCRGGLALAAQNCGWTAPYALTGEITVRDLEVFSAPYCIIGHSERRLHLGESEDIIVHRLSALLAASIVPILCVGETLDQKRGGETVNVITAQLASLHEAFKVNAIAPDPAKVIVAYEPMWAISTAGSNLSATPSDAASIHDAIRGVLDELFGSRFGDATSIIFGGGIDFRNAAAFLSRPEIDGALVGAGMQTASGFKGVLDAFYGAGIRRPWTGAAA
jgi:triosephosphate isomerase